MTQFPRMVPSGKAVALSAGAFLFRVAFAFFALFRVTIDPYIGVRF